MRPTARRLSLLLAAAAVSITLACAVKSPEEKEAPSGAQDATPQNPAETPAVQRRVVNKRVKDFPEKTDLSTPESALAAWSRAFARMDAKAVCELSGWTFGPREIEVMERFWKRGPQAAATCDAYRNAEILEVTTYRGDFADVISKVRRPESAGRDSYSSRSFGRINGLWKNLGEDVSPSLEAAREEFEHKKENLWRNYVKVRDGIASGKPVSPGGERPKRSAPIAPGEPLGISVEKADLMGRVEWAMMHGGRDVTARKSLEWGEVEKDEKGNRTIRYKYYATIWDKDVYLMNQVFTFDAKGNILDMEDVAGFPQKKAAKPIHVDTQEGMKELVEDFFKSNFRDITSRESIEWGKVTKTEDGHSSIRYQYRAKIWDKDTKIMNQVFTFDSQGKFVSVKDVDGSPKHP
jgi:hypothetical protein